MRVRVIARAALALQLAHGQELEDALLDLLQPVVVVVEDSLGHVEIERVLGLLASTAGSRHHVEVGADDGRLGRDGWHPLQAGDLSQQPLFDGFGAGLRSRILLAQRLDLVAALAARARRGSP